MIQVPACDRCTQGVMDATNPHLLGTCPCECHLKEPANGGNVSQLENQRRRSRLAALGIGGSHATVARLGGDFLRSLWHRVSEAR